jgi:hypothetical protein
MELMFGPEAETRKFESPTRNFPNCDLKQILSYWQTWRIDFGLSASRISH